MKKIRHVAYTGPLLEPYQILSERGLRMFTGLRTLKFPHHPSPDVPQSRVQEYQQQVEGDLDRVWAEMRELEGINTPMVGQECEVQWMTRDEWNLTVTDTEEYI
jgi:hypothetical protein